MIWFEFFHAELKLTTAMLQLINLTRKIRLLLLWLNEQKRFSKLQLYQYQYFLEHFSEASFHKQKVLTRI